MSDDRSGYGRPGRVGPGTQLNGTYEIDAPIGEGGMGSVFRGHNIQTGDPVAIKMLLADMAGTPEAMALFRREASVLHALQHDAIVRYFVFSVDPAFGIAYLAMEFVDGPSLSDRMLTGPLSRDEVRVLQRRLADGLAAAHRNGVIHRDISPDNIILPGGDVRRAKIIDFGIARNTRSAEATIIGGGFAGKFSWVSPEQLGLAGADVTDKSDIYSLGLVLAAALQGRPLDMGGSQVEVIEKRKRVPDLSGVDPSFHEVLGAMLQPLPENRPSSMAEVARWGMTRTQAEDLFVEDSYAASSMPLPTPRPQLTAQRPPAAAPKKSSLVPILASGAVVALVAGGGAAFWLGLIPFGGEVKPGTDDLPPVIPKTETANRPPIAPDAGVTSRTGTVGTAFNWSVPRFNDPDGDAVAVALSGTAPPGLRLTVKPDGSSELSGTPTAAGSYKVALVGSDPAGATARVDVTIDVAAAAEQPQPPQPNRPPVAPAPAATTEAATVGTAFAWDLPAFTDPDGDTLTLALSGDVPPGLRLSTEADGSSRLSGTPFAEGSRSFAIVATDPSGANARLDLRIDVAPEPGPKPVANRTPVAPPATAGAMDAAVGRPFDTTLAPFTDPDGDALALSLMGNTPPGLRLEPAANGSVRLTGTPTTPGDYDFAVVGTDPSGAAARLDLRMAVAPEAVQPPQNRAPVAPRIDMSSRDAVVGTAFAWDLPPFTDPDGDAVVPALSGAAPPGLKLSPQPDGSSRLEGTPQAAGPYAFVVIGTDPSGASAELDLGIDVAPAPKVLPPNPEEATNRPPVAPVPNVDATSATVGTPFGWSLPRFVDPDGDPVTISLAGDAPPGLQLVPEKDGSSRLTGKPASAGAFSFGVVGTDAKGASGRMDLHIEVAVATPVEPPPAGPVELDPYLAFYDDGACLLTEPRVVSKETSSFTGYGRSEQIFKEVARRASAKAGFTVTYTFQSVTEQQCPLLDFARDADVRVGQGVTLDIAGRVAGSGRPLKGEIKSAADRSVALLLVTNDGGVLKPATPTTGDGVWGIGKDPAKGLGIRDTDGQSAGFTQILAAISSAQPIAALKDPEAPKDATLFVKLLEEIKARGETVDLDLGFIKLEK